MPKSERLKRGRRRREAAAAAVPYARGFRPPSSRQSRRAIGGTPPQSQLGADHGEAAALRLSRAFDPSGDFFSPVPPPTSIDDWLAQYNEEGQTYAQFLAECPWLSKRKRKLVRGNFNPDGQTLPEKYPGCKIYLVPLGGFEGSTAPDFSLLAEYARSFFCLPVEVLPVVKLVFENGSAFWVVEDDQPERASRDHGVALSGARRRGGGGGGGGGCRTSPRLSKRRLDSRYHRPTGAIQLNARSLLAELQRVFLPDDAVCLVALTMADLFDAPPDLFVAGLAAGNQRVGVFSLRRYDPALSFSPEFWYETGSDAPPALGAGERRRRTVLRRGCKLLAHETAHLLGLDHCVWFSCCMNGAGHLAEDFRQPMPLCPVDLRKLQALCGFDVVRRYRSLEAFFERTGMTEERSWVGRRVEFILQSEQ